jgi:hypothetical protein
MDEQNVITLIWHIPCFILSKLTSSLYRKWPPVCTLHIWMWCCMLSVACLNIVLPVFLISFVLFSCNTSICVVCYGTHVPEGKGKVRLDRCGKYRPPPGFDSQTFQSVVSCHTNYAILARLLKVAPCKEIRGQVGWLQWKSRKSSKKLGIITMDSLHM